MIAITTTNVKTTHTTSTSSPAPTPSTLIDVLSSQAQFSYFLRHLQVNGMIPVLNSLQNVTLLAPINLAFTDIGGAAGGDFYDDNLLRYVVNQRFRVGYFDKTAVVFDTLLRMRDANYSVTIAPDFNNMEYVIDNLSAIVEPDIYAKHQHSFIQGIEKLLPMKRTACEILMGDTDIAGNNVLFVQTLFKQLFSTEDLLEKKKNKKGKKKKKQHEKKKKIPNSCEEFLAGARTIFIPSDATVRDNLSTLQYKYFTRSVDSHIHEDAADEIREDILDLLSSIVLGDVIVGHNGTFNGHNPRKHDGIHYALSGSKYNITLEDHDKIMVNGEVSTSSHEVFANGILHVFGPQKKNFFTSLPIVLTEMIPRKSLFALGFSHFVNELKFRKLDSLIDGSTTNQTLFLSTEQDDLSEENFSQETVNVNSFSQKQSLMYQFAEGEISSEELLDNEMHILVDSKLCVKKKIGDCYKIKLSTVPSHDKKSTVITINDDINVYPTEGISAGNSTKIYLLNKELQTPPNFKHTLGDIISSAVLPFEDEITVDKDSCMRTLGYLNTFDLFSLDDNGKGYSVFLPCAASLPLGRKQNQLPFNSPRTGVWSELGLVLNYLESHPKLFKDILKGMFVEKTLYSNFGCPVNTTLRSKSLRGDFVYFQSHQCNPYSKEHYMSLNHSVISMPLNSDILFNQGVIHLTDKVLIPENFEIPFVDLLKTTLDNNYPRWSIVKLIEAIPGLSDYLLKMPNHSKKYSLLVPSPESLKDFNITSSWKDLERFFQLHLIPNSEVGKLLDCVQSKFYRPQDPFPGNKSTQSVISTNISDASLTCYLNKNNGKTYLKLLTQDVEDSTDALSYNKDHELRILSHGCTTFDFNEHDETCVFLIDKPLNLEWLEDLRNDNFLHIHLGFVSVGVGIVLGLIMFGGLLLAMMVCLGWNKKQKVENKSHSFENPFVFPDPSSSFMRVTSDEESLTAYDRGYETDVDVLRENDYLLKGPKRYGRKGYSSIHQNESDPMAPASGRTEPRSIRGPLPTKGLNRDRNIPGFI